MTAFTVRAARTSDVRGILGLLDPWVQRRILLGKDVVTVENLLTPDTLRRVAWAPRVPIDEASIAADLAAHGARPWQITATAPVIAAAFVESVQPTGDDAGDVS